MSERELHLAITNYLDLCLGGTAWWTTFPAGGGGRSWQRLQGLKLGVPDILVIDGGRAHWLEIKTARGKISAAQEACMQRLRLARCNTAVVRSLDEVQARLKEWAVPLTAEIA